MSSTEETVFVTSTRASSGKIHLDEDCPHLQQATNWYEKDKAVIMGHKDVCGHCKNE